MADLPPAEELRAAAARLREPVGDELLVGLLDAREPLAGLLDRLAGDMSDYDAEEVDYLGHDDVEVAVVADDYGQARPDWTAALATARALLGGGRG